MAIPSNNDLALDRILIESRVRDAMLTALADALSAHATQGSFDRSAHWLDDLVRQIHARFEHQVLRGTDMSSEAGRQTATKMRAAFEELLAEFLTRLQHGLPPEQRR